MYLCADIEKLQSNTGFQVKHSFENGIRETRGPEIRLKVTD